jgi:hypothetical protein
MSIYQAVEAVKDFQGDSLTEKLSRLESELIGVSLKDIRAICDTEKINDDFLTSALFIKKLASQIHIIIHAAGILHSLESTLRTGEVIESSSLGAGNTGKRFDLETNFRIAEYKFIDWQGGSEAIRQNSIFKDFFELAEYETTKEKFLYVIGTAYPLKFFNSGRALSSVLSKQPLVLERISAKYGNHVRKVSDYYNLKKHDVQICDINSQAHARTYETLS